MARPRKHNLHLPRNVYMRGGSYYLVDGAGKWHFLGKLFPDAMSQWAEKINNPNKIVTMNDLFDRYLLEVSPLKAPRTYRDEMYKMKRLREVFGSTFPTDITPVHIYQYLDGRGKIYKRAANCEKALMSNVFSYAIRWGVVKANPCRDVRSLKEQKRDKYVEDWEFEAVKALASPFMKCAMDFAYISGLRRGDIISLQVTNLTEEGIRIITNKTKAKMLIEWTPTLKEYIEQVKEIRKRSKSFYLFCTDRGGKYTASGFGSLWKRLMSKALRLGVIKERFRFHDIRRKTATDHKDIETARKALGHTTQSMTSEYISGWQKSKPLK